MTESQNTNTASDSEGAPTSATPATQPATSASATYPGKKSTSGLAIAGLVVAIVAIVLSWMPFINNVAAIIAIVALALGIAGVVATGKNKAKGGRGIAIAGVILAVVSFAVVMYTQSVYVAAIDSALDGASGTTVAATSNSVATTDTSASSSANTSSSSDSTSSTDSSSLTDLAIGTPVEYSDGMTVVVNSVTPGLVNYDGSTITAVNITYTYNGSSSSSTASSFNPYDWKGQTAAGVQSSRTYYSDGQDELSSGNLAAGGTVTGNLYFDGDTVKVIYSPSMFSNTNQASWIVG